MKNIIREEYNIETIQILVRGKLELLHIRLLMSEITLEEEFNTDTKGMSKIVYMYQTNITTVSRRFTRAQL